MVLLSLTVKSNYNLPYQDKGKADVNQHQLFCGFLTYLNGLKGLAPGPLFAGESPGSAGCAGLNGLAPFLALGAGCSVFALTME